MRHILKLLYNLCKYGMDLVSIVEDTEQTPFYLLSAGAIHINAPYMFITVSEYNGNKKIWSYFSERKQNYTNT